MGQRERGLRGVGDEVTGSTGSGDEYPFDYFSLAYSSTGGFGVGHAMSV